MSVTSENIASIQNEGIVFCRDDDDQCKKVEAKTGACANAAFRPLHACASESYSVSRLDATQVVSIQGDEIVVPRNPSGCEEEKSLGARTMGAFKSLVSRVTVVFRSTVSPEVAGLPVPVRAEGVVVEDGPKKTHSFPLGGVSIKGYLPGENHLEKYFRRRKEQEDQAANQSRK